MDYFKEARSRAKRRKSPWNLLLIPGVVAPWAIIWYVSARVLGAVARRIHPELNFVLLPDSGGGILIALGLLFAWLLVAIVLGNMFVAAIPVVRRTLDGEAQSAPGTDFVSANRGLLKAVTFMTPPGLFVAVVGVVFA